MSDSDVHTFTGAYALNALDDVERRQFERHIAECPGCAHEVAELRATSARLGSAVAEAPPERVRQRVLEEMARTRQDRPGATGSSGRKRLVTDHGNWIVRITSIAAGAALIAAGVFGGLAVHSRGELHAAQTQLAQASARYASIARLLAQPDATLASGTGADGGRASVMVSHRLHDGVFVAFGLPGQPVSRTYQVWLMSSAGPRSAGLLTSGEPLELIGITASDSEVAVTVEPAGGSREPTTTPVLSFGLPA